MPRDEIAFFPFLLQLLLAAQHIFSLVVRPGGHKPKKWMNTVIQFPLFVSSKPHYQAEMAAYKQARIYTGSYRFTEVGQIFQNDSQIQERKL